MIADRLDLRTRSVHQIYTRALDRTEEGLRHSFADVAKNVRDAPRSGRPATLRSKAKLLGAGKGQSRPSKSKEKRPKVIGKSVYTQTALFLDRLQETTAPVEELLSRESFGEPGVANIPSPSHPCRPGEMLV